METKIILLTTNQIIISQITEVPAAIPGEPDCKLSNPFTIKDNDILEPFLLKVTKDDTFMISSRSPLKYIITDFALLESTK